MSATRYIIAASTSYAAKQYSQKRDAIRNADARALVDAAEDIVISTQTGREIYRVPATVVPEPVAVEQATPVRTGRGAPRAALETVDVCGTTWEVLYVHPRKGTETWRELGRGRYAIVCVTHQHIHRMTRLIDDRKFRKDGRDTWCPGCAAQAAA